MPKKKLSPFDQWIKKQDINVLAKEINVSRQAAFCYLWGMTLPAPKVAAKIIRYSNNKITWADIYGHLI
jgi:hypothetical protein